MASPLKRKPAPAAPPPPRRTPIPPPANDNAAHRRALLVGLAAVAVLILSLTLLRAFA